MASALAARAHRRGSIDRRIGDDYAALSPQEQRAADFLLDHLSDLAVYNATELAELSGVSKATISRLFRRLGFESSQEVKDHVRSLRSSGAPLAGSAASGFAVQLDREVSNLTRALDALHGPSFDAVVALLGSAARVVVIGYRNSYPVALHLREQLAQARPAVSIAPAPGQSIGEDLAGLTSRDAVVLVGFRRRPSSFGSLVSVLADAGVPVILVGDPGARRYSALAAHFVECPVDSESAFDSYAAAMSVVGVLANGVLAANLREGRARISAISRIYDELDELEGV